MSSSIGIEKNNKKLNYLTQVSSEKDIKDISSNKEDDKSQKKKNKSNIDLVHINLKKIHSKKKRNSKNMNSQKNNNKKISFLINLQENNENNKDKNTITYDKDSNLINNKTKEGDNINKESTPKTKIFRVIGKKVKNFSYNFENKITTLNDSFQKFKVKVLEIHNKFNLLAHSVDTTNSNSIKIKNNGINFINFNEVYIFERKIIEFIEKQILNYMKIISLIESIFLEDNKIDFNSLRKFYHQIEKESYDFSKLYAFKDESIDKDSRRANTIDIYSNCGHNSNSSSTQNEHLRTEKNLNERNHNLDKFFLPSLRKRILSIDNTNNNDNLNSDTFRNTHITKNSIKSTTQRNKQFDLFKPTRNSIINSIQRNINNYPKLKANTIDKYFETNFDINKSIKINSLEKENIRKEETPNNNNYRKKSYNLINMGKIKDLLKSQKLIFPKNLKQDQNLLNSISNKNIQNNQEINNVNDYILNYNSKKKNLYDLKENKIKDLDYMLQYKNIIERKTNDIAQKKVKLKSFENKKYYSRNTETKNNKNDYERKFENSIINESSVDIIKEQLNDEKNKNEKEGKDKDNKNNKELILNKSESSFENKDPLDDVKYLIKLRKQQEEEELKEFEHHFSDNDENIETKNIDNEKEDIISRKESNKKNVKKFDFLY